VGDDGICMKSGKPSKSHPISGCEDIVVANNTVNHAHGGFVFGSETASGMRRMVVRHNTFSGTDIGLRFKSSIERGGPSEKIGLQPGDRILSFNEQPVSHSFGLQLQIDELSPGSEVRIQIARAGADGRESAVVHDFADHGSGEEAQAQHLL
jgi:S1-C subfamily serine protease